MESKVQSNNYIQIQGWMIKDLGLKGNSLMAYAIIHGFSQVEGQYFTGSIQYIADWTNSTKRGIIKVLNKLVEDNYIIKFTEIKNGLTYNYYGINRETIASKKQLLSHEQSSWGVNKVHGGSEQSSPGGVNKVHRGGEQSSPNNIDYNINNNIDYNTRETGEVSQEELSEIKRKKEKRKVLKRYKEHIEKVIPDANTVLLDQFLMNNFNKIDEELLEKLKESKYLLGETKSKPSINIFTNSSSIVKIKGDYYKDKQKQSKSITRRLLEQDAAGEIDLNNGFDWNNWGADNHDR